MHCVKLLGQRQMARDLVQQGKDFQILVTVLNDYTAVGIVVTLVVG